LRKRPRPTLGCGAKERRRSRRIVTDQTQLPLLYFLHHLKYAGRKRMGINKNNRKEEGKGKDKVIPVLN
jgi:hypothetical protein